jgi:hypothetical protein
MTEIIEPIAEEQRPPRPGFLTVLCVLSFISTGLSLISGLVSLVLGPSTEEQMLEAKVEMTRAIGDLKDAGMASWVDLMEKLQAMSEQINDNFYLASTLSLLTVIIGFYGVIKMWKGFKIGFHLYIGYCLLSIVTLYIYVSPSNIPSWIVIFNLLFSGLFIFLYSRNLKWMR